ncbi:unnamed protein product [Coregonus sp. 'balchen']|nr:unnamed protein product [Coregonus sp. 'balchen']
MADRIIAETERRGVAVELLNLYKTTLLSHTEEAHDGLKFTAAILLLHYLFKEDPSGLYVTDMGNPFADESDIQLFLDGEKLLTEEPEDISMGLGVAMGVTSFLILSMQHQ